MRQPPAARRRPPWTTAGGRGRSPSAPAGGDWPPGPPAAGPDALAVGVGPTPGGRGGCRVGRQRCHVVLGTPARGPAASARRGRARCPPGGSRRERPSRSPGRQRLAGDGRRSASPVGAGVASGGCAPGGWAGFARRKAPSAVQPLGRGARPPRAPGLPGRLRAPVAAARGVPAPAHGTRGPRPAPRRPGSATGPAPRVVHGPRGHDQGHPLPTGPDGRAPHVSREPGRRAARGPSRPARGVPRLRPEAGYAAGPLPVMPLTRGRAPRTDRRGGRPQGAGRERTDRAGRVHPDAAGTHRGAGPEHAPGRLRGTPGHCRAHLQPRQAQPRQARPGRCVRPAQGLGAEVQGLDQPLDGQERQ